MKQTHESLFFHRFSCVAFLAIVAGPVCLADGLEKRNAPRVISEDGQGFFSADGRSNLVAENVRRRPRGRLPSDLSLRPRATELAFLLAGVEEIAFPGVPGRLSVFGPNAFPVVVADTSERATQRSPIIAAAQYGRGRLVAFAHNGYLASAVEEADTGRLMANLIRWAAGQRKISKEDPNVGILGYPKLLSHLDRTKMNAHAIPKKGWLKAIQECDVVVCPTDRLTPVEVEQVAKYVKSGGGLLTAFPGWAWVGHFAKPGEKLAADFPPNQLFGSAGILWSDGGTKTPPHRRLKVLVPAPETHARRALETIAAALDNPGAAKPADLETSSFILSEAVRSLPPNDRLLQPRVDGFLQRHLTKMPKPSARKPVRARDAAARALISIHAQQLKQVPPRKIEPHPAADFFPGKVPVEAKRVSRTLSIETSVPDWHGTGLYAAAGDLVTIRVPKEATDQSLKVRIGCHRDRLWHKEKWERIPEITVEKPIASQRTDVACAFGGLVYVVVPKGCQLGPIDVKISGCVLAPHFVLGETNVGEWRNAISKFPAPWAELETKKIILTVPSRDIRELAYPDKLMTWWDRLLDAQADLRTISRERVRPERIVMDEQISAGYLHAGYPIMGQLHHGKEAVDLDTLQGRGNWGFYHELGHNHQRGDWTYRGMVEVTVNLFSLYSLHTLNPDAPVHRAITDEAIKKHIARFKENGHKGNPFLELVPYVQMQRQFGWEAYQKVFAEYEALPDHERPKNDQEKRDQWLVRFSRAVRHNLGPFFDWWKIETTETARDSIKDLPVWMPEELLQRSN